MIVTLRPVGRGNWHPLVIVVHRPVLLIPELRDAEQIVRVGDVWTMAGRDWRVIEVDPR